MITIKTGKIFCDRYNQENGTNLSPKEIFCEIIAPMAFKSNKYLINITNSKFFTFLDDINKGKKVIEDFEEVLDDFCTELEKCNNGLMTTMNVFGGCALPKSEKKEKTTMCLYNTNIYFNIDERYCSFIGAFFQLQFGSHFVAINDSDFIWKLWNGIKIYKEYIECGDLLTKDKQINTWNTLYALYNNDDNYDVNNIITNELKEGGLSTEKNDFVTLMKIIYPLNIKYFETEAFGKLNTTSGVITLNPVKFRREYEYIESIFSDVENKKFNYKGYYDIFGGDIFYKMLQYGAISNKLHSVQQKWFNLTDNEIKRNKKNINYILKYLNFTMTQETIELAKKFVDTIKDQGNKQKKLNYSYEMDNLLKSSTPTYMNKNLIKLIDKIGKNDDLVSIVSQINLMPRVEFSQFMTFAYFYSK